MKRQSDQSRLMARCARRTTWLPVVCAVLWLALPSIATAQFAGGTGTVADPYLVESAEHLGAMRDHLSAHFKLVADIDLGSPTYSEGPGWEPIGESAAGSRFTGSLDGAGRTIFHLTIDRPSSSYQGLFGYLEGATVKNLRLENIFVQGASYTGALAGHLSGGVIEEVNVSGRITGGSYTGGIAGRVDGSAMRRLSTRADVTGGQYTGGLVGHANLASTSIYQSHAEGSVTGTSDVGGLVGYLYSATLMDSYSRAAVDGGSSSIVGGLVGRAYGAYGSYAQIHRTYSSGLVVGGTSAGGLLGSAGVYGYVSSTFSYWDTETSGRVSSARGIGKTTAEMKQQANFETYDFATTWSIDEGNHYPELQDHSRFFAPLQVSLAELGGSGSENNPYVITTADELNAMRLALDAHYRLGNDIDLSATVVWDGGRGWTPVGTSTTRFTGSLDGAGHAVRSMRISRPTSQQQGLFGYLDGATIMDLRLEHVSIRGSSYTGALVGHASGGVIEAVHVSGQITGDSYTGGVAGRVDGSKLQAVSTDADIWGGQYIGGLVGHANLASTSILQSSAAGSVSGTSDVGGLVGYLYSATLADSYSRAAVDGGASSIVGGLVGRAYGAYGSYAQIHRTYSSGVVTGGTSAGGLLGNAGVYGYVTSTYSYWDVETSGRTTSARGIGKSTAEMKQRETYETFDFSTNWSIDVGTDYPVLQDLSTHQKPAVVSLPDLNGVGSLENPYLITTADELNAMRQALGAHYRLGNDIDLSATVAWDGGSGWMPVGTNADRFTGSLDGAGHAIWGMRISRPTSQQQGLFGYLDGATIKDLRLEHVSIRGSSYTGALVGYASGGVIEAVHVSGQITGDSYTGGVAGKVDGSKLQAVSTDADIWGGQYTGGLVGHANLASTSIYHSSAAGSVSGTGEVGGLVGYLYSATLADSYSRAAVDGGASSIVGGLVGRAYGAYGSYAQIHRTYSSGEVKGGTSAGGLLGNAGVYGYVTSTYSYWDVDTSGRTLSARGIGKSTAEMKQRETYETFDFSVLWSIDVGTDYPVLQDLSSYQKPVVVSLDQLNGVGSLENPYLITTADELNAMRQALGAHYRLGNDIDLSPTVVWDGGAGWTPVGTSAIRFTGSLDGAGHAVRSMTINRPTSQQQGLFGHLDGATIKDLRLENVSVRGAAETGALAGYATESLIEAVYVSGETTGGLYTGGVVGRMDGGSLYEVATAARVAGAQYTGGLAGHANLATASILRSYSIGSVTGTSDVGGLVGYLYSATLTDSYSRAAVDGGTSSIVGGLVGRAYGAYGSYAQIHRTYSSGEVTGGTGAGGLLGSAGTYGYVTSTYSYWDVETSGRTSSARGTGKTTAEMLAEATFLTWDFMSLWDNIEGESYPFHQQTNSAISISPVRRHHRNEASSGHSITVIASSSWLASSSAPWITIVGGSGTGDGSVIYDLAANPSPDARVGIITVTDTSGTELTYTVQQEALLFISPENLAHDSTASGGHSIVVSGNVSWTATSSDGWITITGGGFGLDAGVVVYRIDENESTSPRTGTIMVAGGGITRTVSIRQAGSLPYLLVWPGQREHQAAASAGHEILIYANTSWAASTVDAGIVLTGASVGSGDGVVLYSVDDNLSGAARTGHITITGAGRTYHFRVSQDTSLTMSASASPPASGTIGGTGVYLPGQAVTLTAHESTGYGFVAWLEGGQLVSTEPVYEFAATRNRSLVGVFELNEYAITYAAGSGGTIDGDTAQIVLHGGDAAPVTAVPGDGHHFLGWSDGVLSAVRQDTNVAGDIFVTAVFAINEYLIEVSASPEAGGTVSGGGLYEHGDTVTAVVIPATGYSFLGWTEGQSTVSMDTTYSFQAFGDRALVATLELDHYVVTAVATPAEAGFVSPESQEVPHGESAELMVTASDGYGVESVTGCAGVFNPAESSYLTGAVTAPCTVEAAFVRLGVALRASQDVLPAGESVELTVQVEKPDGEAFETQAAVCVTALHGHGASVDLLAQQLIDAEPGPDGSLCGLTSESGTAVFTLTAGAVGEVDVSVGAGALGSDSVVVSFLAAEPHRLVLTVLDEVVAACHESEVEIRLLDEYGNMIVGPDALATEVVVVGRAESGSPVISGSTLVDPVWIADDTVKGMMPPDGPATVVVTFDAAGLVEVEASSSMLVSEQGEPAEITFELGPADDERSELMAAGSQIYAGAGLVEVTVVPRDACDLSLGPDQAVALHTTFGQLSQPIDVGDGTYVSAFQTDSGDCPAEPAVITATVNGVSLLGAAEILSICGELDELSPVWLETTHGGVDACAAHGEYAIVHVAPRNESGMAMPPGQDVRILENPPWIVAGESREETDPDTGNSYYALEVGSNRCSKDGPTDVIVTVGGVALATAAELAFGCPPVEAGGVTFAAEPSVLEADGVSESVVQMAIVDRCGNAAFGREVSLSILGEVEATLSSESVVTIDDIDAQDDGTAVVRVSSASPGLVGLTATIEQIRHDSAHDLIGFEPVSDSTVDTDTSCGCASGGDAAGGAALLVLMTLVLGPARRRRGIRNHDIGA